MTYLNDFVRTVTRQQAAAAAHSGSMIALIPAEPTAMRLAVPGFESPDILHVTLMFLGKSADWNDMARLSLLGRASEVAKELADVGPTTGNLWAAASLNPMSTDSCSAYLVGGHSLEVARRSAFRTLSPVTRPLVPRQHSPWVPHITIGYGLPVDRLTQAIGTEIRFDRLRVSFADDWHDFPI